MARVHDNEFIIIIFQKTGKLFTGPTARSEPSAYLDEYRVFVLQYDFATVKLKPGHSVLHQVYSYTIYSYHNIMSCT